MIVFGVCVGDNGVRFEKLAHPWLSKVLQQCDRVHIESGANGICHAYNRLIDRALSYPDLELLVLLHDDLKLLDPAARQVLLDAAAQPTAGLLGVVGGVDLFGVRWWEARTTVGRVYEPRGLLPTRSSRDCGPADAVDGMLLALTPAALRRVRFDQDNFPGFHGYDIDICAQVAEAGLRVEVVPIDVFHASKPSVGDQVAFAHAAKMASTKWPDRFGPKPQWRRLLDASAHRITQARTTLIQPKKRPEQRSPSILHEISLGASGFALAKAARESDTLRVWLVPSAQPESARDRVVALASAAGVRVRSATLMTPLTPEIPPEAAKLRCDYLGSGGSWPIYDLLELRIDA